MAIVATIALLPFCRRDDLVLRSRSISSNEQGCYPQDQTETDPLILGKAAENPEHGREFWCHSHQQTTNHQNGSRPVRHELGPRQRFLAKYVFSPSMMRVTAAIASIVMRSGKRATKKSQQQPRQWTPWSKPIRYVHADHYDVMA